MGLLLKITLWAYLVWSSTCNLTDLEWETILPDMTLLCPSVDVCGRTDISVTNLTVERKPCCLGCSCDRDCDGENCCFEDDDKHIEMNDPNTACLKPSVSQSMVQDIYRFLIGPPIHGCVTQDETSTCSSDVTVAPWGNFFPVYSKSLNKNFKNEPCAICHGADTNDIEHWNSYIRFTGRAATFISDMTDFYETYNSKYVTVAFDPPSPGSGSIGMRCFELIDECPSNRNDEFDIPSNVHLGRAEIIKACTHGPRAIFVQNQTHAYKNAFCAMCCSPTHNVLICKPQHGSRTTITPVTGLIDTTILQSSAAKGSKRTGQCFRPMNELNDTGCVEAYCPALQVRTPSGKCEYPAEKMAAQCLKLVLNVSTGHAIDESDILNMDGTGFLSTFQRNTPWQNVWQIFMILLSSTSNRTEFYVSMSLSTKGNINMRKLIVDIERRLTKHWSLQINDEIECTQRIMSGKPGNGVRIVYRGMAGPGRFCLEMSRLFFCQQIELRPNEYKLNSRELHLVDSGKILFDNEYALLTDAGGSQKIRVCLEDSGYVRADPASNAARMSYGLPYIA